MALGSVGATCAVSAEIDDLQFALGEGPGVDAFTFGRPVLEPDLAHPAQPRWLAFTGPAVSAGAGSVFAFPLRVGTVRLGALSLHAEGPGRLTAEQHADAEAAAEDAAEAVLAMQAGGPCGTLAAELEAGSNLRYAVHQAAGMVSVQLDVSVAEALVCLRAHAFGHQRPLADVAADVVGRRLRLE
jgi:hypothetical protein